MIHGFIPPSTIHPFVRSFYLFFYFYLFFFFLGGGGDPMDNPRLSQVPHCLFDANNNKTL